MGLKFKMSIAYSCFLGCIASYSQVLKGTILDEATQTPLDGATIYIDGTTTVALTNTEGHFSIQANNASRDILVVSYVGYVSKRIDNPFQYNTIKVFLEKDLTVLDEVVVAKGPFSRKEMMLAFKENFIGKSKSAKTCEIQNENDIVLFYNRADSTLNATSAKPLKIKNTYLEYEINFDLSEFVIAYKRQTLNEGDIRKSYFSGTTFYKDISKDTIIAYKKRKEKYLGSAQHIMNTIVNHSWKKEGVVLYSFHDTLDPNEYFKVTDTLDSKKVTLIKNLQKQQKILKKSASYKDEKKLKPDDFEIRIIKTYLGISYKKQHSLLDFQAKEFYVDENGNYIPLYGILFGGYIGSLKAGDMLPIDYYQTIKSKENN